MDPFIGEIVMFAGNFAPRGWALCNGQLLAINGNEALFSILGTTYGGDGRTTFALPDLRGRVPVHPGTGPGLTPRNLGQRSGTEYNVLTVNQLAPHTHFVAGGSMPVMGSISATINVNSGESSEEEPNGKFLGKTDGITAYADSADGTTLNAASVSVDTSGLAVSASSIQIGTTGTGSPINNMQPFEVVNFIIATVGIFPSRG